MWLLRIFANTRRWTVPLSITHCPLPIAHSRPGGMRGAIRRPCRRQALACQTQSTSPQPQTPLAISSLQISNPLKSLPQHPRAFRPAAPKPSKDRFCDFQKTLASAERGAKKLCGPGFDATLHPKCKLQDASFMIFTI